MITSLALALVLLPQPRIERDLAYGSDQRQRLDLAVPATKNFGTIIVVHGGSLTAGDKTDADYANVCGPFPPAGFGCASINYRLAPQHPWPSHPEDVAAAVAWVRMNIASRGGDPGRIFLFGHSSGAALAALIASDERYLAKHSLKLSDLRGVIAMGSIMWDDESDQDRDRWPIHHVRRGMPPFLFLIAESEQENPPVLRTNKKFVEEARALGNHGEYEVLAGRRHYTAIRKLHEPGDTVFARIRTFLQQFSK